MSSCPSRARTTRTLPAGRASAISADKSFDYLFKLLLILSLVMAAALFVVAPMIKKMMGKDDHAHGPADKSEKAEPEPLPSSKKS